MFVEIITKKKERLSLNISQIVSVIAVKNRTFIFDSAGVDYEVDEPYDEVMERIFDIISHDFTTENLKR